MNVTIINKIKNTNGNISKEGEHHYAQYWYEVQLPGGIVVKGTSTNTLPRKMAQIDAAQKCWQSCKFLETRQNIK